MSIWATKQVYEDRSQRDWYEEQARKWSKESIQQSIVEWERIAAALQSQDSNERRVAEMYVIGVWADDSPIEHVNERLTLLRSLL